MAMLRVIGVALVLAGVSGMPGQAAERRCGWVYNPTPGNWSLRDRTGEWEIASMGLYEAPGFDAMPDMGTAGWVETNGHYGHGCGCLVVEVDRAARRVTRLVSATPVRLARCRADWALPKP